MLTSFLIAVYVMAMAWTIYQFDYLVDQSINNPIVIILSILIGFVAALIAAILFMEITYQTIGKRRGTSDALKHKIGKQIMSVPMQLFHLKTTVYGREQLPQDPRFLIYSNHTSELDISVLMHHLPEYPVAFLAKEEVGRYPWIGRWAKAVGCVMLNRDDNRQGSQAISQVIEHVQTGSTMVVFPEGTLTREIGHLLKFRSGAFKIALESGVPVVPVTLIKAANYNKRVWPFSRRMDIKIHPPIPYEDIKDLSSRQLNLKIREVIESGLSNNE